MGERLTVQFARGTRGRETFGSNERIAPRPRRTAFRMLITGLPIDTSWQVRNNFGLIMPFPLACALASSPVDLASPVGLSGPILPSLSIPRAALVFHPRPWPRAC
jgi:hypothetical protein